MHTWGENLNGERQGLPEIGESGEKHDKPRGKGRVLQKPEAHYTMQFICHNGAQKANEWELSSARIFRDVHMELPDLRAYGTRLIFHWDDHQQSHAINICPCRKHCKLCNLGPFWTSSTDHHDVNRPKTWIWGYRETPWKHFSLGCGMKLIFPDQVWSCAFLNAVFFSSTLPPPDSDPACRPESEAWRNANGRQINCWLLACGTGFEMIREFKWTLIRSYISDDSL